MNRSPMPPRKAYMARSKTAASAGAHHVKLASKLPPSQPKESRRVESPDYLDTCRRSKTPDVACLICGCCGTAWNPVEPDHERDMTGGGTKESDSRSYPACRHCHRLMEEFKIPGAETGPTRKVLRSSLVATHHADLRRAGHPAAPPLTDSTPAASAAT